MTDGHALLVFVVTKNLFLPDFTYVRSDGIPSAVVAHDRCSFYCVVTAKNSPSDGKKFPQRSSGILKEAIQTTFHRFNVE